MDILKVIRQNEMTKLIPVVILTSSKEDKDVISGYEPGANSYVHRPEDFNEFIQAVNSLGLYWLLRKMARPRLLMRRSRSRLSHDDFGARENA